MNLKTESLFQFSSLTIILLLLAFLWRHLPTVFINQKRQRNDFWFYGRRSRCWLCMGAARITATWIWRHHFMLLLPPAINMSVRADTLWLLGRLNDFVHLPFWYALS